MKIINLTDESGINVEITLVDADKPVTNDNVASARITVPDDASKKLLLQIAQRLAA